MQQALHFYYDVMTCQICAHPPFDQFVFQTFSLLIFCNLIMQSFLQYFAKIWKKPRSHIKAGMQTDYMKVILAHIKGGKF
jgi:hypothetical protein